MTEFELVSAAQGYLNIGMTILMNFFTILTAYLAAGYLSAQRLTRAMATFVTVMFLVMCVMFLFGVYRIMTVQIAITAEMANFAKAGKGLAWLPIASANMASRELTEFFIVASMMAIMIGGIVGGVYFFYDCRKRNPIASP